MLLGIYKPKRGVIYNIGGGRYSNCSVIEALNYLEKKLELKLRKLYKQE